MSADAAAGRIARLIAQRRGGVARFPLPMSLLMSLIARLPDATRRPARSRRVRPRAGRGDGVSPMIDLALKMLLDEKVRFAATVSRRRVRGRPGSDPGGPVLRTARERQHHDRTARRRPLGDGAEHAQRRFRQPFPEDLRSARAVGPRCGAGRQPDRLVRDRGVADRSERVGDLLRAEGLSGLAFSLERRVGRPGRPPPRPLCDARRLGRAPVRSVSRRAITANFRDDVSRSSAGPAKRSRSRPARSPSSTMGSPNRSRPTSCAGGRHSSSFASSRGLTWRRSTARSAAACLTTTSTARPSGRPGRAATGSRVPGLGLTLVSDRDARGLGRRGHRGTDALRFHERAPGRIRHGQGPGRRQSHGLCDRRRAGVVRGGPGLWSGSGAGMWTGSALVRAST